MYKLIENYLNESSEQDDSYYWFDYDGYDLIVTDEEES